jgi:hypothetical protein
MKIALVITQKNKKIKKNKVYDKIINEIKNI